MRICIFISGLKGLIVFAKLTIPMRHQPRLSVTEEYTNIYEYDRTFLRKVFPVFREQGIEISTYYKNITGVSFATSATAESYPVSPI